MIGTAALIASGVAGLIGQGMAASKRKQGLDTMNDYYDYATGVARSQQYSSVFDTAAGKSLLKLHGMESEKNLAAIDNRIAAMGGTIENQLAARQANNENLDKLNTQLLQMDDRNRRAWQEKELSLAGQQANLNANSYYQAAQDWSQWGSQMGNSLMNLGSSYLLGGLGSGTRDYTADMDNYRQAVGALTAKASPESAGFKYASLAPAVGNTGNGKMSL